MEENKNKNNNDVRGGASDNNFSKTVSRVSLVVILASLACIIYFSYIDPGGYNLKYYKIRANMTPTTEIETIAITTPPAATPASNSNNADNVAATIFDIPITTTINRHGDFYVITTRVKNTLGYSIDEKLTVYVEDYTGSRSFVDVIYVDLGSDELGRVDSKISASRAGPPPHSIVTEWR